ncbi:MAG: class I SAM-dependent methyltransferase [Firmicutes bacterium]|nr:class I SAM-dependent methyltransferase [Bacillota bacterium]
MEKIKRHFEEEAEEFDGLIRKLIPYYSEMVEALVEALPWERDREIRVIDLGCGTGTLALRVKERFPKARITCLDLAENMIRLARMKLGRFGNEITYQVGDFYHFQFTTEYDAVVSSLALHHLVTDDDKRRFYAQIYECLSEGGVFFNADVVLGTSERLQGVYMGKWREYMARKMPVFEIEGKWVPKYYEEDRPAVLMEQLKWLESLGFRDVDVIWKYYNFAVYGGMK